MRVVYKDHKIPEYNNVKSKVYDHRKNKLIADNEKNIQDLKNALMMYKEEEKKANPEKEDLMTG